MRRLALLPAALLTGCLILNPGFNASDSADGASTQDTGTTAQGSGATEQSTTGTDGTGTGTDGTGTTGTGTTGTTNPADQPDTEDCEREWLFPDADGDSFGVGRPVLVCPGDGYAGKDGDCDDDDHEVNPNAIERCNGVDDDCDGLTNEFSAENDECDGCKLAEYGGHSYWFCREKTTWDQARGVCMSFGAVDLAMIHDSEENDFIAETDPKQFNDVWLGARDNNPDKQYGYLWNDGSPLAYTPLPFTLDYDNGCLNMTRDDRRWHDRPCSHEYAFTCESWP